MGAYLKDPLFQEMKRKGLIRILECGSEKYDCWEIPALTDLARKRPEARCKAHSWMGIHEWVWFSYKNEKTNGLTDCDIGFQINVYVGEGDAKAKKSFRNWIEALIINQLVEILGPYKPKTWCFEWPKDAKHPNISFKTIMEKIMPKILSLAFAEKFAQYYQSFFNDMYPCLPKGGFAEASLTSAFHLAFHDVFGDVKYGFWDEIPVQKAGGEHGNMDSLIHLPDSKQLILIEAKNLKTKLQGVDKDSSIVNDMLRMAATANNRSIFPKRIWSDPNHTKMIGDGYKDYEAFGCVFGGFWLENSETEAAAKAKLSTSFAAALKGTGLLFQKDNCFVKRIDVKHPYFSSNISHFVCIYLWEIKKAGADCDDSLAILKSGHSFCDAIFEICCEKGFPNRYSKNNKNPLNSVYYIIPDMLSEYMPSGDYKADEFAVWIKESGEDQGNQNIRLALVVGSKIKMVVGQSPWQQATKSNCPSIGGFSNSVYYDLGSIKLLDSSVGLDKFKANLKTALEAVNLITVK